MVSLLHLTPARRRDTGFAIRRSPNSAYPRVISNLGALGDSDDTRVALQMIRFMNHYARTIAERRKIIEFFRDDAYLEPAHAFSSTGVGLSLGPECAAFAPDHRSPTKMGTSNCLSLMYDYFTVGYANTLAYAHANSGDTMTSVMIGGLRTVMNGDFEIFAGDVVQFYWSVPVPPARRPFLHFPILIFSSVFFRGFEKDDFLSDGRRKPYINIWSEDESRVLGNVDPSTVLSDDRVSGSKQSWQRSADAQVRESYHCLSYGQKAGVEKLVAKIKPYIPDEEHPRLNDWYRVFGVAIASARPNEMCDIKISRQSA